MTTEEIDETLKNLSPERRQNVCNMISDFIELLDASAKNHEASVQLVSEGSTILPHSELSRLSTEAAPEVPSSDLSLELPSATILPFLKR